MRRHIPLHVRPIDPIRVDHTPSVAWQAGLLAFLVVAVFAIGIIWQEILTIVHAWEPLS